MLLLALYDFPRPCLRLGRLVFPLFALFPPRLYPRGRLNPLFITTRTNVLFDFFQIFFFGPDWCQNEVTLPTRTLGSPGRSG